MSENISELLDNIEILKEDFEDLTRESWEDVDMSKDELAEREAQLQGLLATIDDFVRMANNYEPTVKNLNECTASRDNLAKEVQRLATELDTARKTAPVAPIRAPVRASIRTSIRKAPVKATTGNRRAPPRRAKCSEREQDACVVEGERNPCFWHEDMCITGTDYKKKMGIKRPRPATGSGAPVPRAGSKKALGDQVKMVAMRVGVTMPALNIHLKENFGKTFSRLTIQELGEVLMDLMQGQEVSQTPSGVLPPPPTVPVSGVYLQTPSQLPPPPPPM